MIYCVPKYFMVLVFFRNTKAHLWPSFVSDNYRENLSKNLVAKLYEKFILDIAGIKYLINFRITKHFMPNYLWNFGMKKIVDMGFLLLLGINLVAAQGKSTRNDDQGN